MKKDYTTILLEEIRNQNKAILEGQKDQATHADIHQLEQRLDTLESDVKTIKAAVISTNRDLDEHKLMSTDVVHTPERVSQSRWPIA